MNSLKISVVIRTKNEESSLAFLLKNLTERYSDDIDEVIVLDNLSSDGTEKICQDFKVKFISIAKFSYGGSANLLAKNASCDIIVIFSAHSFPVSHDFFKQIKYRFEGRLDELAGLRCLHNVGDYTKYINNVLSIDDPNGAGLIFAGSAFNRRVWEKYPFKSDISTFEDKEWTVRVLKNGYKIEFVPSIFCYHVVRNRSQLFFRFKNEVVGSYQLWHYDHSLIKTIKGFLGYFFKISKNFVLDLYFATKRLIFMLKFIKKKPERF